VHAIRLSLLGCCLVLLGCGGGPNAAVAVEGKVMINNGPLDKGQVLFFGSDGKPPIIMEIANGQYSGKAPPGKYRVQFSATKEVPNPMHSPNTPGSTPTQVVDTIPAKYGAESKETAEVTATGPNKFDFGLAR